MSDRAPSAAGLMQQRPFVLFWLARLASTMGYQMLALTIGWQVYEITNSAFDLGLVGLIQFVPAVILTLLIGHENRDGAIRSESQRQADRRHADNDPAVGPLGDLVIPNGAQSVALLGPLIVVRLGGRCPNRGRDTSRNA